MNRSENINELASSLAKAQGAFDHAKKDVKNEFFRSKYADLASCIDAAKIHLSSNGLSVCQVLTTDGAFTILETILMHSSGQWISSNYPVNPVKQDPQGLGSAITYARRYSFCAITGIASDDDDGNAASNVDNNKPEPTPSTKQSKPKADVVDIEKYRGQLSTAKTLAQLSAIWQIIPKDMRLQLEKEKDSAKSRLSSPETIEARIEKCKTVKDYEALIDSLSPDEAEKHLDDIYFRMDMLSDSDE